MTTPNHDKESGDHNPDELTDRRPLTVRHEFRVVHGEEARYVQRRQADAIRALLRWRAEEKRRPRVPRQRAA